MRRQEGYLRLLDSVLIYTPPVTRVSCMEFDNYPNYTYEYSVTVGKFPSSFSWIKRSEQKSKGGVSHTAALVVTSPHPS